MIVWKEERDHILAVCGDVDVGAVFRSTTGRYFRYRVWVGPTRNPADGGASSEEKAKQAVAARFENFLTAAKLQPVPVPPNDMPLIEILAKASSAERRDWLLKCPLALLLRVQHQAREIFSNHGEQWGCDVIDFYVAQLHMTRGGGAA